MIRSNIGNKKIPYLFLMPFFMVFAVFHLYPMFANIYVSMHSFSSFQLFKLENFEYVGLRNFVDIFYYDSIYQMYFPTILYLIITCLVLHVSALFLAKLIHLVFKPFQVVFLILLLLPYLTDGFNFQASYSLIQQFPDNLIVFSFSGFNEILNNIGFYSFVYFVVLQRVHPEIHEASLIEGSSIIHTFLKIELPALYNVIGVMIILSLVDFIQSSPVMSVFESNGQASAFSMIFTLIIILMSISVIFIKKLKGIKQ